MKTNTLDNVLALLAPVSFFDASYDDEDDTVNEAIPAVEWDVTLETPAVEWDDLNVATTEADSDDGDDDSELEDELDTDEEELDTDEEETDEEWENQEGAVVAAEGALPVGEAEVAAL